MKKFIGTDSRVTTATINKKSPATPTPAAPVSTVRESVNQLAEKAKANVKAVRDSFAAGSSPTQVAGSGSVSSFVTGFSKDPLGSKIVKQGTRLGTKTSTAGSNVLPPSPTFDSAEIVEDASGVLDQFSVKLTVSLHDDALSKVSYIKIMRARVGVAKVPKPSLSALIYAPQTGGKTLDRATSSAFRASETGVGNKLTSFIYNDPATGKRSVSSPDAQELRPVVKTQNSNKDGTTAALLELDGADRSVLDNLTFYLNRRAIDAIPKPKQDEIVLGNRIGLNLLKGSSVSVSSDTVVEEPNSMSFSEVCRIDPRISSSRKFGDYTTMAALDRAIVFGSKLVYYAVCVTKDGTESVRSRLIEVSVTRTVPPKTPEILYSVIGGHPRFSIKCQPGTDHVEIFRAGRPVENSIRLGSDQSIIAQSVAVKSGEYWHLTDTVVGQDGSTTFVDVDAFAGDRLSYRIYSVDSYGLKCQTPFSCSLKMPDVGHFIPLPIPSITAEQSAGQPAVSVKFQIDDPRAVGFVLQRRELSINERAFHQPNTPEYVDFGLFHPKNANSRIGPTIRDADWPVYIPASGQSASFLDTTVRIDRKYQYAVGAIDLRGNRSLSVGSGPVGVYGKPVIDPPTAFGAEVALDGGQPTGILLSWKGGTQDFSPNVLLGDQDVLAATAVRSVFQVERRSVGAPFWDAMPSTSESYFFDRLSQDHAPNYRPAYVVAGATYEYRVLAMQSGGFVSPRTDPITISVIPPPQAPKNIWVRSTPIGVNPLCIIVSWDMSSDFVQSWQVERAVVNKVFGEKITSMDSRDAQSLEYVPVASVTPEASRGRALSVSPKAIELDKNVFVGNRFYIDSDVDRSNSFFYRIRTVGTLGVVTEWKYAGVSIKDSAFDKKLYSTLSDDDKTKLAKEPKPLKSNKESKTFKGKK